MVETHSKVALITGGAKRIGATIARLLHQSGINLILHYNSSSDDAFLLQDELNEQRADSVLLIQGDLTDISKIKFQIRESINQMGQLDALINNASAFFPTPIASSNEDQWQRLVDTNLKAPYFITQAAAPYLKTNFGCVINITDIYAERPLSDHSIYCASKAGLVSLTKSLAKELAPEVRVNAISPGAILWPEDTSDELSQQRIISNTPLKRAGEPMDIAETVLFLLEKGNFITGQVINVDGGRTL